MGGGATVPFQPALQNCVAPRVALATALARLQCHWIGIITCSQGASTAGWREPVCYVMLNIKMPCSSRPLFQGTQKSCYGFWAHATASSAVNADAAAAHLGGPAWSTTGKCRQAAAAAHLRGPAWSTLGESRQAAAALNTVPAGAHFNACVNAGAPGYAHAGATIGAAKALIAAAAVLLACRRRLRRHKPPVPRTGSL